MELNQFRHSAFCLKVRMVLEAKKVSYKAVEITPGMGQLNIFRISGQRKVPVLVDGENILADSSTIIRYLERKYPEPQLLPKKPQEAAQVHLLEDWADTTLAKAVRNALLQATTTDHDLRMELLPETMPSMFRNLISDLPLEAISSASSIANQEESQELLTNLKKISQLIEDNEWLVGDAMSFADIAVAAQLSLLKFPLSSGEKLTGKGCPEFSQNPELQPLFAWRDKLELSISLNNSPKLKNH